MAGTGSSLVERANAAEPPMAIACDRPPARPWPDHTLSHRSAERRRIIASIVEHHVVPRLAPSRAVGLLHVGMRNPARGAATNAARALPQADEVKELSALVVGGDLSRALALADAARGRGSSLQVLYLDLLAPTARYLGYLWDTDEMSSPTVAIGLGRLHQILRALGGSAPIAATAIKQPRRALLVAPPGAQHTFGLAMVQDLFRLAAWNVWSGVPADDSELGMMVRQNWFGVVGFSVGCADHLSQVRTSIGKVRSASQNRRIGIMVGGPAFIGHPEYVAQVGADAMAGDGVEAVSQANRLLLVAAPVV
jgi:methanogenic corrinoid protein MtbC1